MRCQARRTGESAVSTGKPRDAAEAGKNLDADAMPGLAHCCQTP